jgi:hypothetical protein
MPEIRMDSIVFPTLRKSKRKSIFLIHIRNGRRSNTLGRRKRDSTGRKEKPHRASHEQNTKDKQKESTHTRSIEGL